MSHTVSHVVTDIGCHAVSHTVGHAAQTRPDQTRVLVTAACGVSGHSFHPSHGDLPSPARPRFGTHAPRQSPSWMEEKQ